MRQKELATALSIEGPSLVRLLDNLERRGLIERREDETDRRARGIHLTRAGRDLAVRVAKIGTDIQARVLAKVPPADLEICEPSLTRSNVSWTRGWISPRLQPSSRTTK